MADPNVFDITRCNLAPLPSLRERRLVTDCTVPDVPPPIWDCSISELDLPLPLDIVIDAEYYARITGEDPPGCYQWQRVFPDGGGGWIDGPDFNGEPPSCLYEQNGVTGIEVGTIIRITAGVGAPSSFGIGLGDKDWRFPAPAPRGCVGFPPGILGLPITMEQGRPVYTVYQACFRGRGLELEAIGTAGPCGLATGSIQSEASEASESGSETDPDETDPCAFDCGIIFTGRTLGAGIGPAARIAGSNKLKVTYGPVLVLREAEDGTLEDTERVVSVGNIAPAPVEPDTEILFGRDSCNRFKVIVEPCPDTEEPQA